MDHRATWRSYNYKASKYIWKYLCKLRGVKNSLAIQKKILIIIKNDKFCFISK